MLCADCALEASFFTQAGLSTGVGLSTRATFLRHRRASHGLEDEVGEGDVVRHTLNTALMTDPLWPSCAREPRWVLRMRS